MLGNTVYCPLLSAWPWKSSENYGLFPQLEMGIMIAHTWWVGMRITMYEEFIKRTTWYIVNYYGWLNILAFYKYEIFLSIRSSENHEPLFDLSSLTMEQNLFCFMMYSLNHEVRNVMPFWFKSLFIVLP